MNRSHKIRLIPNKTQLVLLRKTAGASRYVYNWALSEWEKQYKEYKEGKAEKPSAYALSRRWTLEKPEWASETYRNSQTQAILDLGKAWINYWNHKAEKPAFKKKRSKTSFTVDNAKNKLVGNRIRLPGIGSVKLGEELRFTGKIMKYTVSCEADRWHVSVLIDMPDQAPSSNPSIVGVDVGIKNIAVASDNTVLVNPKNLAGKQKKLKRLQRKLARQVKGSKRRAQTKLRIAKVNLKIVNQRTDSIHKFTAALSKNHGTAVIETLSVQQILETAPKFVRSSFQDTAMKEVHRQLEYKMKVVKAPRFFPSSKTCSKCGYIKAELPPCVRVYKCEHCGAVIDRDLNAAYNLRNMPWVTGSKCVENSSRGSVKRKMKTATAK